MQNRAIDHRFSREKSAAEPPPRGRRARESLSTKGTEGGRSSEDASPPDDRRDDSDGPRGPSKDADEGPRCPASGCSAAAAGRSRWRQGRAAPPARGVRPVSRRAAARPGRGAGECARSHPTATAKSEGPPRDRSGPDGEELALDGATHASSLLRPRSRPGVHARIRVDGRADAFTRCPDRRGERDRRSEAARTTEERARSRRASPPDCVGTTASTATCPC